MRESRERQLASEFFRLLDDRSTSMAPSAKPQPTYVYTDPHFLAAERRALFRGRPLMFCLSGEVAEPGQYVTAELDGLPVVAIRGKDRQLRAMVNMCTHRGTRVYTEERGRVKGRGLSCPFHAWTFDTAGQLLSQPESLDGFAGCETGGLAMRQLPLDERHGIVFVTPLESGQDEPHGGDGAAILGKAEEDIPRSQPSGLPLLRLGDARHEAELEACDRHVP